MGKIKKEAEATIKSQFTRSTAGRNPSCCWSFVVFSGPLCGWSGLRFWNAGCAEGLLGKREEAELPEAEA